MLRQGWKIWLIGPLVIAAVSAVIPVAPVLAEGASSRAAWLLGRTEMADLALTGQRFEQSEIGGGGDVEVPGLEPGRVGMKGAWPVLMSLILPGAGEVATGYKRGYFMAAADIYAWTRVAKNHSDGGDLREEYIAFADEHYSDEDLVLAYTSLEGGEREDLGAEYFNFGTIDFVEDLDMLNLYVSKEDDFREYYENLGKWDQFVFGWDDFIRPDSPPAGIDFTPTGEITDLRQPWISVNRETYRGMREVSNDAFKTRDRWLYANIGLRIFSVLQVAYLQGLLGGGPAQDLEISGHTVSFEAAPMGLDRGMVAATVSF